GLGWTRGEVPTDPDFVVPIGKAAVRRAGSDLTIITYGSMVSRSLEAAERLAGEGIDAEVIDLRSLVPLDWDCVLASVTRTHRALVVHEAFRTAGPGAEIAAQIQERAFFDLDAPVLRLGAMDYPLCQQVDLEQAALPSVDTITDEARRLAAI
ncbi:MAG: alpha-ketoacid dehydrogenase subunit beta, partial [Sphingomonadales bacterium]|nr:alpha-ketoacid dehydrogenase subunit beta [Sphingomonadales bacterium]